MLKIILIIFGPIGSGKGTQAEMLAQKTNWKKISTGDLFRQELKLKSNLGKQAKKYMSVGQLVPDDLTKKIVVKHVKLNYRKSGFIFDGYPRNKKQLDDLLEFFKYYFKESLIYALEVAVRDKESRHRIGGRLSCSCGAVYHIDYNPPKKDKICDICKRKLFIRFDDKPKAISQRLNIYHNQVEPLFNYWRKRNRLIKIDGEQPIAKIHKDIIIKLRKLNLIK